MRSYNNLKKGLFASFIVIISTFQSVNLAATNVVTLDNGKSGTSSTGTWKVSSGANPYGSNSLYSGQSGDAYTYKFNLAAAGEYQVFARWTEWSSRRTSVPYDISHLGGTSTIKVNQRQNGGQWRQLGSIWSFGSTATIKLRSLGNGTTSADAIKLVPVDGNIAPVVKAIGNQSVNEGDTLRFNVSATDSDGTSPVLSAEKLPANAVFIDNNNGTGTFSWPTTSGDAGNYNVTFIATDTSDPTVTGSKTASISVVDGTGPVILDNGKSGTSSTGTWKVSNGANPYGSNSLYSGQSGDAYTYKFNLAAAGEYQVFARWTEWSSRRTSVPYDIIHLGGTSTIKVNQRQNGGQWRQLGSIWSFGTTATIKLRSLGNGTTSADAIKLVPVDGNIAPAVTTIGSQSVGEALFFHDFNSEALHTYTTSDPKNTWDARQAIVVNPDAVKIVNDPDASGAHEKVMQVFYAAGQYQYKGNSGAQWLKKLDDYDELYFAFDVFFESDAEFVEGGKLPSPRSTDWLTNYKVGTKPDGTDFWTAGLSWFRGGELISYAYHASQSGRWGQHISWDDGPDGKKTYFTPGKWHRVEIRVKINTPGVLDGRLQGWFDGEKRLDTKNLMFRMPGGEHLRIGTYMFYTFFGGNNSSYAPSTDQHIYFDNVVISPQPITH